MYSRRSGMVMTEVVILMSVVLIACAVAIIVLPGAMTKHYEQNRNVLAAPM